MPREDKPDASDAGTAIRAMQGASFREHAELFYSMHELSRLVSTSFDKAMVQHRLTHAQWWALMYIFEREGVSQTELATIMQMGRAAAGKLLERLEAKRWIERRPHPSDSRIRCVCLRMEVVPVFGLMTREGTRLFRGLLKGVSPEEEARLLVGLQKITRNAERRSTQRATSADTFVEAD